MKDQHKRGRESKILFEIFGTGGGGGGGEWGRRIVWVVSWN